MSKSETIPLAIRRFILTSVDSIPHLEAILLLRYNPKTEWDDRTLAQRLFITEKKAGELLTDLHKAGFLSVKKTDQPVFWYNPVSPDLREIMDKLSEIYSRNLIEVTHLIHSKINKHAQQFGDAFRWQNKG